MAQTVLITLTTAGADTGPFDLYSNIDGFLVAFETNVTKGDLIGGYVSTLVPDAATTIRVKSSNILCSNYVDLVISTETTTTTTTTSTSTTTTTTEAPMLLYWSAYGTTARANLKIYVNGDPSPIINVNTNSNVLTNNGSFVINNGDEIEVVGAWNSGSSNEVRFRVCSDNSGQLNYTDMIGVDVGMSTPKSYTFTYNIVEGNIYVYLRNEGDIVPSCPIS